ncbi:MAG: patatin-like phospholipase family protein [Candidatus Neomarinimicrobiota bacterium]
MWNRISLQKLSLIKLKFMIWGLILISTPYLVAQTPNLKFSNQPKIGLILSGGGALGFAHIPTLKILDSLEIPIDYIAGTSMGGIAGALYSIGYTGIEVEQIAKSVDWLELFSDKPNRDLIPYFLKKDDGKYQFSFGMEGINILPPSGLIRGQKISLLLSKLTYAYEKVPDFDHLPIPFRCTTVDLITGNEVILKDGSLAKAMRSTMAIPTAFYPVAWGDSLLIDGGLLNNLPVDVVKDMGADFVIAVDVGRPLKNRSELRSIFKILEQTVSIPAVRKREENIKKVDIFIEPKLHGYNPAGFGIKNIEEIIAIGEDAANIALPKLIDLKKLYTTGEENNIYKSAHDTIRVFYVNITGFTTLTFKYLYDLFDIKSGDLFYLDTLASHIQHMRNTGNFESIKYKINYLENNKVGIQLQIKEMGSPLIHKITIRENKSLPFSFIYNRLGLNIGQTLDIDLLNERINALYSLGYFETIRYEIEPVKVNEIHLVLYIQERPQDLVRLGLHYDETNKFVGSIKMIKSNIFLKGLRLESTLQLAGLTEFNSIFYFPRSNHGFSLYPYFRLNYKNIPINIFGTTGTKIAIYHNRSFSVGGGFGISLKKHWDTKAEYNIEYMNVTPIVSMPDDSLFPDWKDKLHTVRIISNIDRLDNVLTPTKGIYLKAGYEGSYQNIGSDVDYTRFDFSLDYYKTMLKIHTIHFYSYYGYGTNELPVYKWHHQSGPAKFVGAERDEFAYYHISIFRVDYRRQINRNLYLKFIYNIAPNYGGDYYPIDRKVIQGYGVGIKYNTVLGPIELIYGRGDPIKVSQTTEKKDIFYLNIGYNF